jgi:SAM-dependent methyltransferase
MIKGLSAASCAAGVERFLLKPSQGGQPMSTFDYEAATLFQYQAPEIARLFRDLSFEPGHGLQGFLTRAICHAEQRAVGRALDRSLRGRPAELLLDVPCGTGKLASVVASRAKRVVAADVSEAKMALARPAYATVPGFEGFQVADAEDLPFADDEFDAVVCLGLLHRVPHGLRRKMVRELARVSSDLVVLSLEINDPAHQLRSGIRRLVPGTPTQVPCSTKEARELFEEAGLEPFRARPILPMLSAEWVYAARKI